MCLLEHFSPEFWRLVFILLKSSDLTDIIVHGSEFSGFGNFFLMACLFGLCDLVGVVFTFFLSTDDWFHNSSVCRFW